MKIILYVNNNCITFVGEKMENNEINEGGEGRKQ